ncbi:AimR family lysis-lysogeny pheromone receptor [Bacillus thuringiensis]
MEKVMNELLTKIESAGFSRRQFAIKLEMSRETFRRGISCESEMDAGMFFKATNFLYDNPEKKREITKNYFLACTLPSHLEIGLIYFQVQADYDSMKKLIEKHRENSNLSIFFTIYKLFNKRNNNELRGQALYEEIRSTRFSANPHVQVMVNILYMLALADKPNNNASIQYVGEVESNLKLIKKGRIRDYLRIFADERIAFMHLWRIELEECRKIAYKIIDSDIDAPMIRMTGVSCLAESFQIEDPIKAEALLVQSGEMLKEIKVSQQSQKYLAVQTTLAHVRIYNNINIDKIDVSILHPTERASFEYRFGDRELAISIFEKLKEAGHTPFSRIAYSMCINDIEGIKQALLDFELMGLSFYGRMYKMILNREGAVLT